jgi:hypothetical protein
LPSATPLRFFYSSKADLRFSAQAFGLNCPYLGDKQVPYFEIGVIPGDTVLISGIVEIATVVKEFNFVREG